MLGNKATNTLKYKSLGNKAIGNYATLGSKFSMPARHSFNLMKEHDDGVKPVRVMIHDNSDISGINPEKSSQLERGRRESHLMRSV